MPGYSVRALAHLDGHLVLQTPWGLLAWPLAEDGHEVGAVGTLSIDPAADGNCTIAQQGRLALLRCNRFSLAVLLPPGTTLPQRAALTLRLPPVETSEGAEDEREPAEGCSCPPCPPVPREELLQQVQTGCCPL